MSIGLHGNEQEGPKGASGPALWVILGCAWAYRKSLGTTPTYKILQTKAILI